MDDKGVAKFVDVIRDLVKNEVDKTDSTIVCKVVAKNKVGTYDYTYDVYVEPDETNVISGIQNASNSDIEIGDYVYLYKIKNQLNNSFIFKKIGGSGSSSYVSILEDKISTLVTKDDFSTSITQTAEEIKLRASKAEVSSELSQRAEEIYAQVVKKNDSNSAGFGWSITAENGFIVYRTEDGNKQEIIQANNTGLTVQGQVKAESGYIGNSSNGFKITDKAIYNGDITSYSKAAGTNKTGVYIGTDGIKLGDKFSVSPDGTVIATTLKTIDEVDIDYGYSTSGVDPTTVKNWGSDIPTVPSGQYLWTRTTTVYTIKDSSGRSEMEETYSVSRIGEDGTSVEIKGNVENWGSLEKIENPQDGDGYIVDDASDDPDIGSKENSGILYTWSVSSGTWAYCGQIRGPQGERGVQGYSIVSSVTRNNFTDAQWATYGETGHEESWNSTSATRNGCRIGDLFTVVGQSTDTKAGHTLTYKSTTASGDLRGVCMAHQITARGEKGEAGDNGTSKGYVYQLGTATVPSTPASGTTVPPSGWSSNILFPTTAKPYCYVSSYIYDGVTYVFGAPVQYSTIEGMTSILSDDGIDIITKNSSGKYIINVDAIQGNINANNALTIAGFSINNQSFYNDNVSGTKTPGDAGSVWVSVGQSSTKSIAGSSGTNSWAFAASNTFGVTTSGALYSASGNIGGFRINSTSLEGGTAGDSSYVGLSPSGLYTIISGSIYQAASFEVPSGQSYGFYSSTSFNTNNYYGYKSNNHNIDSSYAVCKITFTKKIQGSINIGIRSYAESTYDYTIISKKNASTVPLSAADANARQTTSGNQQSGAAESNYTFVTYDDIAIGDWIYIVYRKDNSLSLNDDYGYFLVPKTVQYYDQTTRAFQAGQNFYVTTDGNLYANKGSIGNIDISPEGLSTSAFTIGPATTDPRMPSYRVWADSAKINTFISGAHTNSYDEDHWVELSEKGLITKYSNSSISASQLGCVPLENLRSMMIGPSPSVNNSKNRYILVHAFKTTFSIGEDTWHQFSFGDMFKRILSVVAVCCGTSSNEGLSGYKGMCMTYFDYNTEGSCNVWVANDGSGSRPVSVIVVGEAVA